MAVRYAKGKLKLNEKFRHEGILGTVYEGELIEETMIGEYKAVVPTLLGEAWIYGYSMYVLDNEDSFVKGFKINYIWG